MVEQEARAEQIESSCKRLKELNNDLAQIEVDLAEARQVKDKEAYDILIQRKAELELEKNTMQLLVEQANLYAASGEEAKATIQQRIDLLNQEAAAIAGNAAASGGGAGGSGGGGYPGGSSGGGSPSGRIDTNDRSALLAQLQYHINNGDQESANAVRRRLGQLRREQGSGGSGGSLASGNGLIGLANALKDPSVVRKLQESFGLPTNQIRVPTGGGSPSGRTTPGNFGIEGQPTDLFGNSRLESAIARAQHAIEDDRTTSERLTDAIRTLSKNHETAAGDSVAAIEAASRAAEQQAQKIRKLEQQLQRIIA
jgi:uncharacterized surface protein with fasciclin (FAS1) repeats